MRNQLLLSLVGLWGTAAAARNAKVDPLLQKLHGHASHSARYEAFGEPAIHARSDAGHRFLNSGTSKFAVNGSGLPEVHFDVGESYAGQLPISGKPDERDHLYFWFFPTANEENKDKKEIVIWLNGGPGCSSLLGLMQENGPFVWQPGTSRPVPNPWSWHLLTNVVWIEQPVTVGFSQGNATAKNEDDVAEQFLGFWKNFIDTFSMHGWKVYIGAESYGGYYGPYIGSHMVNTNDTTYNNLGGLLVYDGIMFNDMIQSNVIMEPFVQQHYDHMPLDDSTMQQIHDISQRCGFTDWNKKYLTYPPAGPAPRNPPGVNVLPNGTVETVNECGSLFDMVYAQSLVANPCFNIYNIPDHCPQVFDPLSQTTPYFDRADVKRAINAPLAVNWTQCVDGVFNSSQGDQSAPPGKYELPNVIDKTKNVILAHGAMDFILPLNGVLLGIQNMTWGGKLGFQTAPSDPFYVPLYGFQSQSNAPYYAKGLPAGSGVAGTAHHERGLTLVVTQLAGHEGPGYAPASSFRHLEKLIGRVHSVSDKTPFTLPQLRNITQVAEPLGKGTVQIPCLGRGC
ncbi:Carboxypeptidase cpdS [Tolypocladium ophioglossoides CBS 100239]|uniref:Carboxypeptidase n=1 Tax=Tolypocladium ophioglossoides (strain CBS 100239) TaxID=1163406 RepID=A0A0L0NCS3_TOLOC|nr:Carboxypeptidase cpdS [Tolypocladium ophioglossoides CBS 100239]